MENLQCIVERITFQNQENGYSVIKVKAKGYRELITAVGNMAFIHVGSVLSIEGEWKSDSKYGKQFHIMKYKETLPASVYGIERYLGSGLIKGIGPIYAKKIVNQFGKDTLTIIENIPGRLIEVEGIGKKKVETIKKAWQEQKEIKTVMLFLQSYDVSTSYATKIFKEYGRESIKIVKENPYRLADDIWGIGFKTADGIAMKLGIDKESYMRCRSGILYTLNALSNEGHCYANWEQLVKTAIKLLDIEESIIIMTASHMKNVEDIIMEENRYYLPSLYFSEAGVVKWIKKILKAPRKKKIQSFDLNSKIKYDEIQKKSIKCAIDSKFMIITGGPGTGKTTTMTGIIEVFEKNHFKVILAAPTGRAAKRMSEASGKEAKTIHRLLDFKPPKGYQKKEENPLEGDVLIVDESSMIDIVLMYNLLKAIPLHMIVIMIGDTDQLPSVGPGNVFQDIIKSGVVPVVKLEKIYRQAENSDIIKNAHKINRGEFPLLKTSSKSDFFFIEQEENSSIPQLITELCTRRLPKSYGIDPLKEIQVLCPMQKGDTGAVNLNTVLQSVLNKNTLSIQYCGSEFYLNDRVMQIKNNYDKEVFNGDMGTISKINLENREVMVDFEGRKIKYEWLELDEITLAYAVTIHKSQGSEYPIVIMPFTMSHFIMLQRNLLYTGITRAKKMLILIGTKKAIAYAVKNNKVIFRNTDLSEKLKEGITHINKKDKGLLEDH